MSKRWPKGGILPDSYGLSLTVFCKDATKETPVKAGDGLKFDAAAGDYGVRKAIAGEVPDAYSKESVVIDKEQPVSVHVSHKYVRNIKVSTDGSVAVGDSIEVGASDSYVKAAAENGTLVVKVNAANKTAEVLI